MATGAESALTSLVSVGATFAKLRLQGWYKRSKSIDEFSNKVSTLHVKLDHWNNLLKRFGKSEEELILPSVTAIEDASRRLDKEEDRLQKIQSTCCCLRSWRKVRFPDELVTSFQKVIDTIDGVPLTLTAKEEALEALEIRRQHRMDSIGTLPFAPDSKYVPLSGSLLELQNALENEHQVVTLYGPPGLGKSMMVQHLALKYQDARLQSKPRQDSSEISTVLFPDGVFYLDCGPDADSRAKHLELLRNLGSRPKQVELEQSQDLRIQSEYDIHNRLCTRLSGQSVLIILDDVCNEELIQQLLVPEKSIKYLITSQRRGVWEDSLHIKIQAPSLEEARTILANYVGGLSPHGAAASELQALAEDVIKAADFNPLVLANWGLALRGERSADPAEWVAAKEELFEVVDDEDDSFSGPIGFIKLMYPRLAASSTIMSVDVLPSEAQSLLLLATLCAGPSVPEQVLKIFFESIHGSKKRSYLKWRNHLEDRSFIHFENHRVPWRTVPIRTWSVNRLRQHFIRKVKKDAVNVLVESILGEKIHNDANLVIALSAIYGVEELRAGASRKIGMDIKQNVSVWRCVEPFIYLLEIEGGEAWEQQTLASAKEVIFQFVRKGRLAEIDLSRLLLLPETSSATCWAIEIMAWNWSTLTVWGALSDHPQKNLFKWTPKNKGAVSVFNCVLELLRQNVDASTLKKAGDALVAVAWASHDISLPAASSALRELVALVTRDVNSVAQEAGARALGKLANLKGRNSQDISTVGGYAGVIEGLVKLLVVEGNPSVQTAAAEALYFLAGDRSSAERLICTRGALQKLADLLSNSGNPDVQQFAVLTLYNLSCHKKDTVQARYMQWGYEILQDKEVVPSSCPVQATTNLERLSELHANKLHGNKQTANRIVAYPGILRGLVGLLHNEVKPVMKMLAVSTFKRLVEIEDNRQTIAKFPGALEGLARVLHIEDLRSLGLDIIVQAEAAETLMLLGKVQGNVKQVPGVVQGLKDLLAEDVHPYVQERAAHGLTIIDPIRANQVTLYSGVAYQARAVANIHMGLFHQALADLDKVEDLEPGKNYALHELRFVKAMLGDYDGALIIANKAVELQPGTHFCWAERGVLKRLMGDNAGALVDLDKALELRGHVYQYLKQRGFVRFLIGDEAGAMLDARAAMNLNPGPAEVYTRVYDDTKFALCELSVAFLGYTL